MRRIFLRMFERVLVPRARFPYNIKVSVILSDVGEPGRFYFFIDSQKFSFGVWVIMGVVFSVNYFKERLLFFNVPSRDWVYPFLQCLAKLVYIIQNLKYIEIESNRLYANSFRFLHIRFHVLNI